MRLDELMSRMVTCNAGISITGLCEEYWDGPDSLMKEDWYQEARNRKVKWISVTGFDEHSFEFSIEI